MRVNLDRAIGWKGECYSGECDIPDDLAIALGLAQAEATPNLGSTAPTSSGQPPNLGDTLTEQTATKPTPKRKRGS
jgi:hypothetical protein